MCLPYSPFWLSSLSNRLLCSRSICLCLTRRFSSQFSAIASGLLLSNAHDCCDPLSKYLYGHVLLRNLNIPLSGSKDQRRGSSSSTFAWPFPFINKGVNSKWLHEIPPERIEMWLYVLHSYNRSQINSAWYLFLIFSTNMSIVLAMLLWRHLLPNININYLIFVVLQDECKVLKLHGSFNSWKVFYSSTTYECPHFGMYFTAVIFKYYYFLLF